MFVASPALKKQGAPRHPGVAAVLLLATCGLAGCATVVPDSSSSRIPGANRDEQTPTIRYDERGRIKELSGLRTDPSSDPTCRLRDYTVDFVDIEREQYLVFQLPSTFRVWVKVEGEMQRMFADAGNAKAREFLSKPRKYKLTAYACDGIGHTSYETVSVEALD
jgi:hypothetical protein